MWTGGKASDSIKGLPISILCFDAGAVSGWGISAGALYLCYTGIASAWDLYFTGKSFEICEKQAGVEVYGAERFSVGNKISEKTVRISVTTPPSLEVLTDRVKRLRRLLQQ